MTKKTQLNQFKTMLEEERGQLISQLAQFAKQDPKLKADWDTRFPPPAGGVGDELLEEEADRLESYESSLAVEHSLESRLKEVETALARIKKGDYGKCARCSKAISLARLKANPAATTCAKCK